MKIHLLILI